MDVPKSELEGLHKMLLFSDMWLYNREGIKKPTQS